MNDFQVVCYGQLLPGNDQATVQRKVAVLFKAQESQVAPFFSGKRVVVKSGLPQAKAIQYKQALTKAGIEVHVETQGGVSTEPTTQESQKAAAVDRPPRPPATTPATLATPTAKEAPQPSAISMPKKSAAVSVALDVNDEYAAALTSQVDDQKLGQLQQATVAPTGTEFDQSDDFKPPALDLSHLSVSELGEAPLEPDRQVQAKPIDISHLSIRE